MGFRHQFSVSGLQAWVAVGVILVYGCSGSPVARFTGEVGPLGAESGFSLFTEANEGKIVEINISMDPAKVMNDADGDGEWFAIWEECEGLEPGEKPAIGKCSGTEYHIPRSGNRRYLVKEGGRIKLKGRFVPKAAGGPLQGLMTEVLEPAS